MFYLTKRTELGIWCLIHICCIFRSCSLPLPIPSSFDWLENVQQCVRTGEGQESKLLPSSAYTAYRVIAYSRQWEGSSLDIPCRGEPRRRVKTMRRLHLFFPPLCIEWVACFQNDSLHNINIIHPSLIGKYCRTKRAMYSYRKQNSCATTNEIRFLKIALF